MHLKTGKLIITKPQKQRNIIYENTVHEPEPYYCLSKKNKSESRLIYNPGCI